MKSPTRASDEAKSERAALRLPERLDDPGLLVGWSLEQSAPRRPIGFTYGDPDKSPSTGYIDPILLADEGHLVTIAPTGAGKGVSCVVPALLRHRGPVVVVDPGGESAAVSARRRRALGQSVQVLDPLKITDLGNATLNPLDLVDPESATAVDDAATLAASFWGGTLHGVDRLWEGRVVRAIGGMILHLAVDHPPEHRTPGALRGLIGEAVNDGDAVAQRLAASRHPEVRQLAAALRGAGKDTLGSALLIAQEAVEFLRAPLVQEATHASSFPLGDVTRGEPLSIYLVLPPHTLESHGPLLRVWVSVLMSAITRRRARPAAPTLFVLDEAAQLGPLPQLRQAITLLRAYGLQTWSFWQDPTQLQTCYPADWRAMINNCRVLQCFGARNMNAAADMASLTGFVDPQRIIDLGPDEMVLQLAGDEAILAKLPNYLTDPPFAAQFDPNPYYDASREIMPRPIAAIRFYQRHPQTASTVEPTGRNPGYDPTRPDPLLASLLEKWPSPRKPGARQSVAGRTQRSARPRRRLA